ncbi:hypothetical protein GIB67_018914 [Kingdonia uniflora]|uniref:Aminotransferase-like plant mobile domain-containing protein n=1 Tax=Kingdonia uniflora TaxID=39325 RepID=A0A7J7L2M4_9MAGN|nr:hypothetical protein GIB67_018914 [Kingdonia uniflora]
MPPTASNRRKESCANEGVSKPLRPTKSTKAALGAQAESAQGVNIPQGLKFETESAQAALGAQPPLLNIPPNFDVNIPNVGGYYESERDTSTDDVDLSNKSHLMSFRFHKVRLIALGQEKLPIRVHHHQSTWDLTKDPQVVQDFLKLKGWDRIWAISYNYYNFALISSFVERWQPKTNSFHFKWGEKTPTLDDVEKLKEHYAYKLDKILNDGTTAAARKKKGLTAMSAARAYMLYVLGSFLFPMKKGKDVSARYLYLFTTNKVAKKWSWGSIVLAHMYYNRGAASRDDGRQFAYCTTLLELARIPKEIDSDVYEHYTCLKWDISVTDRDGGTTLLKFRETFDNFKLEDYHEHASLSPNAHGTMQTRGRSGNFYQ